MRSLVLVLYLLAVIWHRSYYSSVLENHFTLRHEYNTSNVECRWSVLRGIRFRRRSMSTRVSFLMRAVRENGWIALQRPANCSYRTLIHRALHTLLLPPPAPDHIQQSYSWMLPFFFSFSFIHSLIDLSILSIHLCFACFFLRSLIIAELSFSLNSYIVCTVFRFRYSMCIVLYHTFVSFISIYFIL